MKFWKILLSIVLCLALATGCAVGGYTIYRNNQVAEETPSEEVVDPETPSEDDSQGEDGETQITSLEVLCDEDGYYVEMGEYPTTFAGYVSEVSYTLTDETFTLDSEEYSVYTDEEGNRYIQYVASAYSTSYYYSSESTAAAVATWFKLEPIKWDILGITSLEYVQTEQTSTSALTEYTGQELAEDETLIVQSRYALYGSNWETNSGGLLFFNESDIYDSLTTFFSESSLSNYTSNIVTREVDFNTEGSGTGVDCYECYFSMDIWLLSADEVNAGWFSFSDYIVTPTDFSIATGLQVYYNSYDYYNASCWLRTSFYSSVSLLYACGYDDMGIFTSVSSPTFGVRPAMAITL